MCVNRHSGGHSHIRDPVRPEPSFGGATHLGENHHKMAIPAGNVANAKKSLRLEDGFAGDIENAFVGHDCNSWCLTAPPLRELTRPRAVLRRHIPGATP
jgi:hypothetical protein